MSADGSPFSTNDYKYLDFYIRAEEAGPKYLQVYYFSSLYVRIDIRNTFDLLSLRFTPTAISYSTTVERCGREFPNGYIGTDWTHVSIDVAEMMSVQGILYFYFI